MGIATELQEKILDFALDTQTDFIQIQTVSIHLQQISYAKKQNCRLEGDFSDEQILAIQASMRKTGHEWKASIAIVGTQHHSGRDAVSCKITSVGVKELLLGNVQWTAMSFRDINFGGAFGGNHMCIEVAQDVHLPTEHEPCCRNLQVLELINCERISWHDISHLARSKALRSLQQLRILAFTQFNYRYRMDDHIFMAAQRFTSLRELVLCQCSDITDEGLQSYYTFQRDRLLSEPDIPANEAHLGQQVKVIILGCEGITMKCVEDLQSQYPASYIRKGPAPFGNYTRICLEDSEMK